MAASKSLWYILSEEELHLQTSLMGQALVDTTITFGKIMFCRQSGILKKDDVQLLSTDDKVPNASWM